MSICKGGGLVLLFLWHGAHRLLSGVPTLLAQLVRRRRMRTFGRLLDVVLEEGLKDEVWACAGILGRLVCTRVLWGGGVWK